MPASKNTLRREVPPLAIIGVAVLAVVVLGYFGWKAVAGGSADVGPPKKVYPGMYDLRAEAAKARATREQGASQNGP